MNLISLERLTKSAFQCEKWSRPRSTEISPKNSEVSGSRPASKVGAMLLARGKKSEDAALKDKIGIKLTEHEVEIVTKPTSPA